MSAQLYLAGLFFAGMFGFQLALAVAAGHRSSGGSASLAGGGSRTHPAGQGTLYDWQAEGWL